jgi:FMN phosphatase YigB (HAD superfamily)
LALITNISGKSKIRIRDFPEILEYFDGIVYAGESGIPPKPDKIPFLTCLDLLKIKPQDAIFVGDDFNIDICGAIEVGITPLWLKHEMTIRNWPDINIEVKVIHSLYELLNIEEILKDVKN